MGPSPRVRGSHTNRSRSQAICGSIPACAGEPSRGRLPGCRPGVHPRVCGGARQQPHLLALLEGPSPRVRGSRHAGHSHARRSGSIPACAGEPFRIVSAARPWWVHPRVCGGAIVRPDTIADWKGPSPRVRGSHGWNGRAVSYPRSIPACAGEPARRRRRRCPGRVHPRVCGGADVALLADAVKPGPSPRVRGSPGVVHRVDAGRGSIPACAGEPKHRRCFRRVFRVHPRVCGGAVIAGYCYWWAKGPSPRVRGSLPHQNRLPQRNGSIPACAGEPRPSTMSRRSPRVHPRVCGGAACSRAPAAARPGPSPRVRGSHSMCRGRRLRRGSIPACAGEPPCSSESREPTRVHPRVCGGAYVRRTACESL